MCTHRAPTQCALIPGAPGSGRGSYRAAEPAGPQGPRQAPWEPGGSRTGRGRCRRPSGYMAGRPACEHSSYFGPCFPSPQAHFCPAPGWQPLGHLHTDSTSLCASCLSPDAVSASRAACPAGEWTPAPLSPAVAVLHPPPGRGRPDALGRASPWSDCPSSHRWPYTGP